MLSCSTAGSEEECECRDRVCACRIRCLLDVICWRLICPADVNDNDFVTLGEAKTRGRDCGLGSEMKLLYDRHIAPRNQLFDCCYSRPRTTPLASGWPAVSISSACRTCSLLLEHARPSELDPTATLYRRRGISFTKDRRSFLAVVESFTGGHASVPRTCAPL